MIGIDAVKPGGKRGIAPEFGKRLIGFDENFLRRVLGLRLIGEQHPAITPDALLVPANNFTVSIPVSSQNLQNDFKVFDGSL